MAIGFASDDGGLRLTAAKTLSARHRMAGGFATKYWTPEVHVAAFALSRFVADIVAKAKP
jgi:spermidine synthase